MTSVEITNIGELVTNAPEAGEGELGIIRDAAMIIYDGEVVWHGPKGGNGGTDRVIDAGGRTVIPGFVDSHAHLMFDGDRAEEFSARMAGRSYSAGGIRTTVDATRAASDQRLRANLKSRVDEMHRSGITTFETKSGYGLTVGDETRSLAIASEFTDETTFLGAHVVAPEYQGRADEYVSLVVGEMLKSVSPHAKWIDVFCDRGAFDADQADAILTAGEAMGLLPRIHANQLEAGRGIEVAVKHDCASADHCTHLTDKDIELLAGSNTVATLLPGAEFSTRSPYPDAKRLFEAGVNVAIATDCNPGSSYTTSMAFCIAVAVRDMGFTPEQALLAATAGGARALRNPDIGGLFMGQRGDFVILDAPSYIHLAYRPGVDLVHSTYIGGVETYRRQP